MTKPTWIGNSHKKEFHRQIKNQPQPIGCQLDEIMPEHRVVFRTAKDAKVMLYDACAYCTKKFKSRH